jgi:hypothetical protein
LLHGKRVALDLSALALGSSQIEKSIDARNGDERRLCALISQLPRGTLATVDGGGVARRQEPRVPVDSA